MLNDSATRFTAAQHRDLHQHNLSLVLHALRNEVITRTTLARRTGLTLTTIGRLVTTLIDLGLVTDTEPLAGQRRGRPASGLGLNSSILFYGVEITADDITLVELTLAGESRLLRRMRIPHAPSPVEVADVIAALVNTAATEAVESGRRPFGIGLAVPALVDHATQVIGVSASLAWREVPLTRQVHDRLEHRLPMIMDGRAKCHALAQADRVSEGGRGTLVHLEVDLTVGHGIVVDGTLQLGSRGYASNIGHVPLDPQGPRCQCGNLGCLEALAGLRHVSELSGLDLPTTADATPASAPPRDALIDLLVTKATAGDTHTLDALRIAGHWLGVGCVSLLHTLDPDVISIGGYPPPLEQWVLPHVRQAITDLAQYDYAGAHELIMAPDRSGIARGAATMCLYALLADPLSIAH